MELIMTDDFKPHPNQFDLTAFKAKLAPKNGRGRREKYPWSTMNVLDCFFVPGEQSRISSVRSMSCAKGRDLDKKFSVTIGPDGGSWVTRES